MHSKAKAIKQGMPVPSLKVKIIMKPAEELTMSEES